MTPDGSMSNQRNFIVIRHLPDANEYGVDYGSSDDVADLNAGPRFATLDLAIAWVEKLDRKAEGEASRALCG